MNVKVRNLIADMRFATAIWAGLALFASASLSLDVSAAQVSPNAVSPSSPDTSAHWALYQQLADRRAPALQPRPDFSGHWILNAKASDDPRKKAKEALQAMKQGGGHGRGGDSGGRGRGGGMGGGMGSGHQGHGSPEGMGGRGEMPSREISALIATTEKLDISHEDPMLLVTDENDQRQHFFTDFRGASVSISGGAQQRVAVAGWEGDALVIETAMNNGSKLIQNYQIDARTGQLMISAAVDLPEMQAVSYRLVYDRLKLGTDAGSQK
jgi:hypothetical protein